jgi:hypothetical protein
MVDCEDWELEDRSKRGHLRVVKSVIADFSLIDPQENPEARVCGPSRLMVLVCYGGFRYT